MLILLSIVASLLILFLKGIWAAQSYFHGIKKKDQKLGGKENGVIWEELREGKVNIKNH